MTDTNRYDYARLIDLFSTGKITYHKAHNLWVFGEGDSDPMAARVVEQYCVDRAAGRTQRLALSALGFLQLTPRPGLNVNLLERHTAVRDRIASLTAQAQTPEAPAVHHAEISIRPHVTYGVHRFWSTQAGMAGTEMIAEGLSLPRAQEVAQSVANHTVGSELFTMVMDETICVNDETGRDEVPAAFEHIYKNLLELPFGVSYTVSLVNLRQGGKKQPALRIQRHIPVPVEKPEPVNPYEHDGTEWDKLTVAEMRQTDAALCGMPYAAAKLMRLEAYRTRNTGLLEALNRVGAATDVVDPSGHYPRFGAEVIY